MIEHNARFYFANLAADVSRCARAGEEGDESRYQDSLARAHKTLGFLQKVQQPAAYQEGLLMITGLELAREDKKLPVFNSNINTLAAEFAPAL